MSRSLLIPILSVIFSLGGTEAFSFSVLDSTGIISVGGKRYVTHQVEAGETLYSLSRRYGADVQEIRDANPGSAQGLKAGSVVRIPIGKGEARPAGRKVHPVAPGETLYAISRQYGVDVEALRDLNNLTGNSLRVGQKLLIPETATQPAAQAPSGTWHVVQESETLYSISRLYNTTPAQLRTWNNLEGNELKIGQRLRVAEGAVASTTDDSPSSMLPGSAVEHKEKEEKTAPATPAPATPRPAGTESNRPPERDYSKAEKVTERGLAEVINNSDDTRKYLAMHRTAPIGTIMQIKNEMNGQVVFVRVVGAIQSTGDNDRVLVMISKKAYERLGAVDRRFPVEISYIP